MKLFHNLSRSPALCSLLIMLLIALLNWLPLSSYKVQLVSEWSHIILLGPMLVFNPYAVFIIYHVFVFLFFMACLKALRTNGRTAAIIFITLFLIYTSPLFDFICP